MACTNKCNRLAGKVSVITASTDGYWFNKPARNQCFLSIFAFFYRIGFAIAERLAQEGSKVVISSRKSANVEKAVKVLQSKGFQDVHGVVCHVGNINDRKKLFAEAIEKFSGIDVLVSNAAVNPEVGSVLDASEKAWDKIFDINVKSSFLLAKEVKPFLRQRGGGSIIFIRYGKCFLTNLLVEYSNTHKFKNEFVLVRLLDINRLSY